MMKIELNEITVKTLTNGFLDNAEAGVVGYGGKLDIRPPYQREFIYKDKQRDAVIDSVRRDFPLNVMYWAVRNDGDYEVIDGQQRTLSICQYVNGDFSIDGLAFHNLQDDQQQQIFGYKLMVYFCSGTDSEKLDWFRTINIPGEEHTEQEILNAVYAGPWTADAKRYFSKTGCAAYGLASDYIRGSPIRQEYLETAIDWQSNGMIKDYMSQHQHDANATALWHHFQGVISWVKATFPKYRKEMKGVQWGRLYSQFQGKPFDTDKLEQEVTALMTDDDVTRKSGIYPYVLNRDERHLNIRAFSENNKREAYERQKGVCPKCTKHDTVAVQIGALTDGNERRQETLRANLEAKLVELKTDASMSTKALREEVAQNLQALGGALTQSVEQISQAQKERLDRVSVAVTELTQKSGEQQEALRATVEQRLDAIRTENSEKLEHIRLTVEEKLQSTLNERLGASFQIVSDWLEKVHRSMGEMQTLATGVGDLKRLLTNVKARGTWGEVALGNVLEETMARDQFDRNVEIVPGSNQRVEYAVRLPGDGNIPVWLPVDSKFPTEDYERLEDARQRGDIEGGETAAKAIENAIRIAARDISAKYIHSPHSTDFAVLFLPTEGLFAEVIRRPGLVDALQRDYHIMVAGPTNLVSLLVAIRMGFRSLAIQQRSGELSAVKTEFGKFGGILDKVSKKLRETQDVMDTELDRRRRAMDRTLHGLEILPEIEAATVLKLDSIDESTSEAARREAAE